METIRADTPQEQKHSQKKPYHSPKLRACGSVKEQTRTGWGTITDTAWTGSASIS